MNNKNNNAPDVFEWPNELVLEFLTLYESNPVIWNPKHPKHKYRSAVYDAWVKIQGSLSVQFTVKDLKKKKESVMASFRQLRNKVKASENSLQLPTYKPNWFAYDAIEKFMKDIYEPRSPKHRESEDIITIEDEEDENHGSVSENINVDPKTKNAEISILFPRKENRTRLANPKETSDNFCDTVKKNFYEPRLGAMEQSFSFPYNERNKRRAIQSDFAKNNLCDTIKDNCELTIETTKQNENRKQKDVPDKFMNDNNCETVKENSRETVKKCFCESQEKDECSLYAELLTKRLKYFDESTRDILMHNIDNLLFKAKMRQRSES